MAKYSDAQKKAIYKYRKEKYKQVSVAFPKAEHQALEEAAKIENESLNKFIRGAVKSRVDSVLQGDSEKEEDDVKKDG